MGLCIIMTGVTVCCGTVNSIKALWETRIKKSKDELKKEREQRDGRAVGRYVYYCHVYHRKHIKTYFKAMVVDWWVVT